MKQKRHLGARYDHTRWQLLGTDQQMLPVSNRLAGMHQRVYVLGAGQQVCQCARPRNWVVGSRLAGIIY